MTSVLFYDGKPVETSMALGQMLELMWACYIRGKELGYNRIFVEWHNFITIRWFDDGSCISGMPPPSNRSLDGIKIINKGEKLYGLDKIIDINKEGSLYEGCPPLISERIRTRIYEEYLLNYYLKTGIKPKINIVKLDNLGKYIMFHYRYSEKTSQLDRNVPNEKYIEIIDFIRKNYPEYKIYKTGEKSDIDNLFDCDFGCFLYDTDKLINMVSNSKLYIGPLSGPISIAFFSQHPCIALLTKFNLERKTPYHRHYSEDTMFLNDFNSEKQEVKAYMDRILNG